MMPLVSRTGTMWREAYCPMRTQTGDSTDVGKVSSGGTD
jgi:hypothetical protein